MKQLLIAVISVAAAAPAAAQDPLSTARDLYASAAYEEALATLGRLPASGTAASVLERAGQYRAFCLFALGRTADARLVAEDLIRKNPTMELDPTDASPRISAMFTDVRRALLPDLIRDHYRLARVSIDDKDYSSAEPQLARVRAMLDEAEAIKVADESLSDMRVLVEGFLELARTLKANAEAADSTAAQAPAPAQPAAAEASPPAPAATMFDQSAPDVVAPVAILQEVPPVPTSLMPMFRTGQTTGMLDVLVDERGNVERSAIRQSINPAYDEIVLRASKQWRYRPATNRQGPMKYLKTIAIVVQK